MRHWAPTKNWVVAPALRSSILFEQGFPRHYFVLIGRLQCIFIKKFCLTKLQDFAQLTYLSSVRFPRSYCLVEFRAPNVASRLRHTSPHKMSAIMDGKLSVLYCCSVGHNFGTPRFFLARVREAKVGWGRTEEYDFLMDLNPFRDLDQSKPWWIWKWWRGFSTGKKESRECAQNVLKCAQMRSNALKCSQICLKVKTNCKNHSNEIARNQCTSFWNLQQFWTTETGPARVRKILPILLERQVAVHGKVFSIVRSLRWNLAGPWNLAGIPKTAFQFSAALLYDTSTAQRYKMRC